jgi:hypothetical protein
MKVTVLKQYLFLRSALTLARRLRLYKKLVGYESVVVFFSDAVFYLIVRLPFWNRNRKQCWLKHAGIY